MSLESYLSQLSAQATHDSTGTFSLSLPEMLSRFSQSLLIDPSLAPLLIVAAALYLEARSLEVQAESTYIDYRLEMDEPDLQSPLDSRQSWLLLALAANRSNARRISLICPRQGQELSLTPEGQQLQPCREAHPRLTIRVEPAQKTEVLRRHCGLSPVPITLQGQPLQTPLAEAYRGRSMAWSEGVPALLRPPGPASLTTPLALFLAASRAAKPTWVAVIGGISYPFLLPQAPGVMGLFWCNQLSTDLALTQVIQDDAWNATIEQILAQVGRWVRFDNCDANQGLGQV